MAIKRKTAPKPPRRVPLKRPGSDAKKNVRRVEKPKRSANFSWPRPVNLPLRGTGRAIFSVILPAFFLILFAAVSVGLLYGYRSMTTAEYFSLKTIEIQGNSRLNFREVLEIAQLNDGGANTLAFSISAIEEALARNPWIKDVSVRRVLPDTLIIGIREKEPAFWVLREGRLYYADEKGSLIAPVTPGKFASLPALEVEPGAEEATRGLPDLVRSLRDSRLPLDMASISWVRLSAARGVEIFVEDMHLKISIGLEEWLDNVARLGRVVEDLRRRGELGQVREIKAQGPSVWVEKRADMLVSG